MRARYINTVLIALSLLAGQAHATAQERGAPPPPAGRAAAPIDLTGYWVSFVTEDWRFRMLTPRKGDYQGVPMTPDARRIAEAWDPAVDERAGDQCKSYGAAAIMRMPGRLHVTWQDDNTLRIETDAGTQTRVLRFGPAPAQGPRTWQGNSAGQWERAAQGRGAGPGATGATGLPGGGSLKVVTTNMRAGYLRKNGVPYSENAVLTEYFEVAPLPNGNPMLLVTSVVEDPQYLQQPFIISTQFKKEPDGSKWDPTPCTAR